MTMEYSATAKYVRVSTRKVRLVADAIRGKVVSEALALLSNTPKSAALPLSTVIKSAQSNAGSKKSAAGPLTVTTIEVMEGPVMKRWHAVSRGIAHGYKKRMTHIRIVLTDSADDQKRLSAQEGKK